MEQENKTPIEPNQEQTTPTGVQEENNIPQSQDQTEMPLEKTAEPSVETAPAKPKRRWLQYTMFSLLAVVLAGAGYLGYTNPQLFRAAITEVAEEPAGVAHMIIPEYNASPQDTGNIALKFRDDVQEELDKIYSISFKLEYSPVDTMTFNENSIVFDDDTLFKSADLKSVNTDTPGEIVVSFFSNDPVTPVQAGTIVKLATELNGTPGGEITLNVEDVEVVVEDPGADIPYKVSTYHTAIDSNKINLVTQSDLRLLNAEALDDTHVLVRFSDLLSNVGVVDDYTIGGLTVAAVESGYGHPDGYDQSTVMLTTLPQTPGAMYALSAADIEGNTEGNLSDEYIGAIFYGYDDTVSSVTLQSVETLSSTLVVLHFSGALDENTVTPVNVKIEYDSSGALAELTVTNVEIEGTTVRLTTEAQTPDTNYFVTFENVTDMEGGAIGNAHPLNFFGYITPPVQIGNVTPSSVTNEVDQVLVVIGTNMDVVTTARLDSTTVSITEQIADALNVTIPAGFAEGIYDLTLVTETGLTVTLEQAVLVTVSVEPMRIISEESRAIPDRVPPDGVTEITFWVLVADPADIENVDSVTIDLEQIGGDRTQEMVKDDGLQQQGQQFYTYTTTVDPVTPTQDEAYELPVEVKKGGDAVQGTVSLYVTHDVLGSVAPVFDQVYVNPSTVSPDGVTEVTISAKVTDPDGADTITSVIADLGSLGVGFVILNKIDVAGQAGEQVTGWYASDAFTIPEATEEKDYTVIVTASDSTGENSTAELSLNVSTALTGPSIDPERSYIGPRKSVPKDNKTPFAIHAMVGDPNGMSDIDTVNAYFGTLGLPPVSLLRDPNASESAKKALFSSGDITIPYSVPLGVHEIEVIATDQGGGTGSIILQVDVTYKDTLGDAPLIFDDKSYTSPRVAINDGQTRVTLYAFVRDDDNDLESVVVNLSSVGQVGPETPPDFAEAGGQVAPPPVIGDGTCATGSNTIVCMQPSFKEGRDGQWFILPDVVVLSSTPASQQPYEIEVIATDAPGKTARGKIKIMVQDGEGFVQDSRPPEMIASVPVSSTAIEVIFSEEINPLSIVSNGANFTATDRNDISKKLNVIGATISAIGDIVTLTTSEQEEGKEYVLTADNRITDLSGSPLTPGSSASFQGFEDSSKLPVVHYVSATYIDTVEVEFQKNLRPSSVKTGEGGDFNIKIFESESFVPLAVTSVRFVESGKLLEIKTAQQKTGQRYRIQIEDIASAAGVKLAAVSKVFKAINIRAIQQASVENAADLNGDGKVDFIDFTMFSSVYGQVFGNNGGGSTSAQGLSPQAPDPDSLVPHTEPVN